LDSLVERTCCFHFQGNDPIHSEDGSKRFTQNTEIYLSKDMMLYPRKPQTYD